MVTDADGWWPLTETETPGAAEAVPAPNRDAATPAARTEPVIIVCIFFMWMFFRLVFHFR